MGLKQRDRFLVPKKTMDLSPLFTLKIDTIGGYKPIGICGSGLIDAVACMLKIGVMDETGRILDDEELPDNAKIYSNRLIKINNQKAFLLVLILWNC